MRVEMLYKRNQDMIATLGSVVPTVTGKSTCILAVMRTGQETKQARNIQPLPSVMMRASAI